MHVPGSSLGIVFRVLRPHRRSFSLFILQHGKILMCDNLIK